MVPYMSNNIFTKNIDNTDSDLKYLFRIDNYNSCLELININKNRLLVEITHNPELKLFI